MRDREIWIRIPSVPYASQTEVAERFGKNTNLVVTFQVSNVERHGAEPAAGFPLPYYEVTDVDVVSLLVQVLDDNHDVVTEREQDIAELPKGIVDYIKEVCIEIALDNSEWAREFADAEADRYYESMMEDRREREYE